MHRPRRAPIWIAAFAVLLHLFAMPLMAAHMQGMSGSGGHCPMADAGQSHVVPAAEHHHHDHSASHSVPESSHHQGMPCCCAAGSASLAAIPTGTPSMHEPQRVRLGNLPPATAPPVAPRYRWPSLNPRASPLA